MFIVHILTPLFINILDSLHRAESSGNNKIRCDFLGLSMQQQQKWIHRWSKNTYPFNPYGSNNMGFVHGQKLRFCPIRKGKMRTCVTHFPSALSTHPCCCLAKAKRMRHLSAVGFFALIREARKNLQKNKLKAIATSPTSQEQHLTGEARKRLQKNQLKAIATSPISE